MAMSLEENLERRQAFAWYLWSHFHLSDEDLVNWVGDHVLTAPVDVLERALDRHYPPLVQGPT